MKNLEKFNIFKKSVVGWGGLGPARAGIKTKYYIYNIIIFVLIGILVSIRHGNLYFIKSNNQKKITLIRLWPV